MQPNDFHLFYTKLENVLMWKCVANNIAYICRFDQRKIFRDKTDDLKPTVQIYQQSTWLQQTIYTQCN